MGFFNRTTVATNIGSDAGLTGGEVTIGYNSAEIDRVRQAIATSYSELCQNLEISRTDMINAIKACWFGPDCDKYIETINTKLDAQNEAVKSFFNTIASESDGLLTTLENEWKSFQNSVTFE